jgi:hypothetical protein
MSDDGGNCWEGLRDAARDAAEGARSGLALESASSWSGSMVLLFFLTLVVVPIRDVPDLDGNWSGRQFGDNGAFSSYSRAGDLPPAIKKLEFEKDFSTVCTVIYTGTEGGFISHLRACGEDVEYLGLPTKVVEERQEDGVLVLEQAKEGSPCNHGRAERLLGAGCQDKGEGEQGWRCGINGVIYEK